MGELASEVRVPEESHRKQLFLAVQAFIVVLTCMALCYLETESSGSYSFFYTTEYQRLSSAPYSPSPLQSRSFMPFIAYVTGMGGENYLAFSYIVMFVLLFSIFAYLYKETNDSFISSIGTLLVSELPCIKFGIFAPGWPDQFCYLMLLLSILLPRGQIIFGVFGLLAHEFYVVLLACFYLMGKDRSLRGAALCVAPIAAVVVMKSIFDFPPEGEIGPNFLFRTFMKNNLRTFESQPVLLGFLSCYQIFILLVPVAVYFAMRRSVYEALPILIPIVISFLCLFVAHDTTRVCSLVFPALLLTIRQLHPFRNLLTAAAVVNLFVPSYSVGAYWSVMLGRTYGMLELKMREILQFGFW